MVNEWAPRMNELHNTHAPRKTASAVFDNWFSNCVLSACSSWMRCVVFIQVSADRFYQLLSFKCNLMSDDADTHHDQIVHRFAFLITRKSNDRIFECLSNASYMMADIERNIRKKRKSKIMLKGWLSAVGWWQMLCKINYETNHALLQITCEVEQKARNCALSWGCTLHWVEIRWFDPFSTIWVDEFD